MFLNRARLTFSAPTGIPVGLEVVFTLGWCEVVNERVDGMPKRLDGVLYFGAQERLMISSFALVPISMKSLPLGTPYTI